MSVRVPLTMRISNVTHCNELKARHMMGDTEMPRTKPSVAQSRCCCAEISGAVEPA